MEGTQNKLLPTSNNLVERFQLSFRSGPAELGALILLLLSFSPAEFHVPHLTGLLKSSTLYQRAPAGAKARVTACSHSPWPLTGAVFHLLCPHLLSGTSASSCLSLLLAPSRRSITIHVRPVVVCHFSHTFFSSSSSWDWRGGCPSNKPADLSFFPSSHSIACWVALPSLLLLAM